MSERKGSFSKIRRARFITVYAETGNIAESCRQVGIDRQTYYNHLGKDEAFAQAVQHAELEAIDALVAEARRRAVEGVPEPHFYQGQECGTVRKYSDTLLMFLIRQRDPSFRDHVSHEHSGKGGGAIRSDVSVRLAELTEEELLEHFATLQADLAAAGIDPKLLSGRGGPGADEGDD